MPIAKACIERLERGILCGALAIGGSRCKLHQRAWESRRKLQEPWRLVYDDPRWTATSLRVRARDGYRCTFVVGTKRCATTDLLSCHHGVKLRVLWKRFGEPQPRSEGWSKFLRAALDERNLRTLCEPHHRYVDARDPEFRSRLNSSPPQATSTARRRKQAGGRLRKKRERQRRAGQDY